jgi:hypothetical protein
MKEYKWQIATEKQHGNLCCSGDACRKRIEEGQIILIAVDNQHDTVHGTTCLENGGKRQRVDYEILNRIADVDVEEANKKKEMKTFTLGKATEDQSRFCCCNHKCRHKFNKDEVFFTNVEDFSMTFCADTHCLDKGMQRRKYNYRIKDADVKVCSCKEHTELDKERGSKMINRIYKIGLVKVDKDDIVEKMLTSPVEIIARSQDKAMTIAGSMFAEQLKKTGVCLLYSTEEYKVVL